MPRKRYRSDRTTTVLRVTKTRAKEVRGRAGRARKTVFVLTDEMLAFGLNPVPVAAKI